MTSYPREHVKLNWVLTAAITELQVAVVSQYYHRFLYTFIPLNTVMDEFTQIQELSAIFAFRMHPVT